MSLLFLVHYSIGNSGHTIKLAKPITTQPLVKALLVAIVIYYGDIVVTQTMVIAL